MGSGHLGYFSASCYNCELLQSECHKMNVTQCGKETVRMIFRGKGTVADLIQKWRPAIRFLTSSTDRGCESVNQTIGLCLMGDHVSSAPERAEYFSVDVNHTAYALH